MTLVMKSFELNDVNSEFQFILLIFSQDYKKDFFPPLLPHSTLANINIQYIYINILMIVPPKLI